MTDNEFLLAISNMLNPIRKDVSELRAEITELGGKVTSLEGKVTSLEGKVTSLGREIDEIREEVREIGERVRKVELTQENVVLPRLQNIEACYMSTFERYKNGVEEHEQIKDNVSLLAQVVMEHSEKLKRIS